MSAPARVAVAALAADHGAHIVLADSDKRPCWLDTGPYSWPRRRPSPEVIEAHPGRFGIVPWSIQTTGLDVDNGDALQLSIFCSPVANLRTRRGRHLYCADNQGRQNGRFELAGCRGDIRGDRGYLVLHYDGAERLLDALRHRDDWQPRDLFELVGMPAVRTRGASDASGTKAPRQTLPGVTLTLAEAFPGCRWNVLLRFLGDVARVTNRPRRWPAGPVDVDAWNAEIRELAFEARERMPAPRLPAWEVRRLAYLVSTWFASGGRRDHSPETQRWRGRRGGRPRLYEPGAEPWTLLGVSRATWYRQRAVRQKPVRTCVLSGGVR